MRLEFELSIRCYVLKNSIRKKIAGILIKAGDNLAGNLGYNMSPNAVRN